MGAVDLLQPTQRALVKRADQARYLLKYQVLKPGKGLNRVCSLPQLCQPAVEGGKFLSRRFQLIELAEELMDGRGICHT